MLCGFEDRHINANFGNDITCGGLSNARDVRSEPDQLTIGFEKFCDSIVQFADDAGEEIRMFAVELYFENLAIGYLIANDRGDNIVSLIFSSAQEK